MKIVFEPLFQRRFLQIIDYIAKDKKSVAMAFKNELQLKISNLKTYPKMCRQSLYADDENVRDLIYKGYTIVYEIRTDSLAILDIFKWQDK